MVLGWLLVCSLSFAGPRWGSLDDPPTVLPRADDPGEDDGVAQAPEPGGGGPSFDPTAAEPLGVLSPAQTRFLKPKRHRLPQDPYGQVDFTAYTLDPGELRLGLGSIRFGLLPRVHVGTAPVLDLMQIYNLHAKWNPVRVGPVDVAAVSAYWFTPRSNGFHGSYLQIGGQVSVRVTEGWTMHASTRHHTAQAAGIPDPGPAMQLAGRFMDVPFDTEVLDTALEYVENEPWGTAEAWSFELATDLRFNRRDAIVLRFGWVGYADVEADLGDVPPPPGMDPHFAYRGPLPVSSSYVASISYQISWKQLNLRLGAGQSALPFAWVPQAADVSYSVGGTTNRSDSRLKSTWRKNRRDVRHAAEEDGEPGV